MPNVTAAISRTRQRRIAQIACKSNGALNARESRGDVSTLSSSADCVLFRINIALNPVAATRPVLVVMSGRLPFKYIVNLNGLMAAAILQAAFHCRPAIWHASRERGRRLVCCRIISKQMPQF
jgi:hypothetical protein